MTVWFVAVVPLLIMLFALAMERVESRLRHISVQEHEVEEFLEQARPNEVRALYGSGIGRALELFRLRRLGRTTLVKSRKVRQRS
ncbi:MAG: hypothetical protein M3308_01160 [Actinomycetota bacterium]|nr:hypothetical protein [Actinomycetota bacterium]